MSQKIQMLAVGDVVTDAFIELLPSEAEIEHDSQKHPLLCMTYGAKIPFSKVIIVNGVGNAANAAVTSSRLGLQTAFYTNIGDDEVGEDILYELKKNHISTELVIRNQKKHSNYHYVLWYKDDRTILIKHEEYNYHWPNLREHQIPQWIYLSSIAESGQPIHDGLEKLLTDHEDIKFAFQPGTFQIRAGLKKLKALYKRTEIFAANKEEYQQILNSSSTDEQELIMQMHELGPKIVLLTDGPKGAFASDGSKVVFMPPYPDPKPPVDRTGAGDSYSSTFTVAISEGRSLEEALAWAGVNSMSVVGQVGAQAGLLTETEIIRWLKKAPESYKAKIIS